MTKIVNFTENQILSDIKFLIKTADVLQTHTGKDYLNLTLADDSGEINAKVWNITENDKRDLIAGKVCVLSGKITSYNGNLQVTIYEITTRVDQDFTGLIKSAPEGKDELLKEFNSFRDQIHDQVYKTIVNELLDEYGQELLTYPAAKRIHHNYQNGLLEHTVSILKLVKTFANQYPQADRELLYAGAILHDLGKVIEYSGVLDTHKTTAGILLGHISIVDGMIAAVANKLDLIDSDNLYSENNHVTLLRHVVLAHHGKLEYGSPVEPMIIEAVLLNKADDLDAEMNTLSQAETKTADNDWTDKIFSEGNRKFYKHN